MKHTYQMRFAGSGGQGVILASIIIAEAAVIDGRNAAQTQSYGPEARGGICKAETIVSDETIKYAKVRKPDFLLTLNQASFDKYSCDMSEGSLIIADESVMIPADVCCKEIVCFDILGAAKEATGRYLAANIAAVGVINEYLGLFSERALSEAVKRHIPEGTEEMNLRALEAGRNLVRTMKDGESEAEA